MQKCNVGNGAGYKTTENDKVFLVLFYLDLIWTWVKGRVHKVLVKTLYFSYFYLVYGNVLHRLIMKN